MSRVKIAVAVAIVGILACFAVYVWGQSRVPEKANVAAIEWRYSRQVKRLAEYAVDYSNAVNHPLDENTKRLFDDRSIVSASVYSSNSLTKGGTGIKPPTTSSVGTYCWLYRTPSPGKPVVNMWRGGGREFVLLF